MRYVPFCGCEAFYVIFAKINRFIEFQEKVYATCMHLKFNHETAEGTIRIVKFIHEIKLNTRNCRYKMIHEAVS